MKIWKEWSSRELSPKKSPGIESGQSLPARVTMEVGETPITIESLDAAKVESIVKLLIQDFQIPVHTSAETKIQPGIIHEGKETYQANDPTAHT